MNPDFLETEAFQKGAACRVLRKYPAGKLVHPSCRRCFDQRGNGRTAGAAAAMIAPDIDREFADAAIAEPAAVGKRRRKSDRTCFPGFGDHHEMLSSEPSGNVCSRARLGLERGDPVGNAFIVDRRDRRRVGGRCLPRPQCRCIGHQSPAGFSGRENLTLSTAPLSQLGGLSSGSAPVAEAAPNSLDLA